VFGAVPQHQARAVSLDLGDDDAETSREGILAEARPRLLYAPEIQGRPVPVSGSPGC
jgi:hypothetical protein